MVALYLGVVRYSLQADDLNMFHVIRLSHTIYGSHGPKQNGSYCWLHKIWTGNNCNFTDYKITRVVLTLQNDLNHANTKEF